MHDSARSFWFEARKPLKSLAEMPIRIYPHMTRDPWHHFESFFDIEEEKTVRLEIFYNYIW